MQKIHLTKISRNSQASTFRMIALRGLLLREMAGERLSSPTVYTQIKKEIGITGTRKSVLRQITKIIEERV